MTTQEQLQARVRQTPLLERLEECTKRLGNMCSDRRGPRMTIPVNWDDDDFFMALTFEDAREALRVAEDRGQIKSGDPFKLGRYFYVYAHQNIASFLKEVFEELERAKAKFPAPDAMLAAIFEEGGEVTQAMMDKPWSEVRKECVQLAVTALRLAVEGDPTLRGLRVARGLDYVEGERRKDEGGRMKSEVRSQREDGIVDFQEDAALAIRELQSDLNELNQRLIDRTKAYEKREAEHFQQLRQVQTALDAIKRGPESDPSAFIPQPSSFTEEAPHA